MEKAITLISDPKVLEIPIVENHERLVDLKDQKLIAYGPYSELPDNSDHTKIRRTVYEKLLDAQLLLPKGLKFCLYEGYRSLDLQKHQFDTWFTKIRERHPQWSQEQVFDETTKLVSPVVNKDGSLNYPPHSTGAAVDVYLVDEKGQNIWPDRYMILLSRLMLEKKPGSKIVFDVKVSQALPEDITAHGGVPIMWKTGHSHIKEKMAKEKAELAGEMSGHIFFADGYYGFDDAIFAALKLLEYFSRQHKKVSELVADTPYYISTPALHAECPDEKKYQVVEQLTKDFKKDYEVIDINGARVLLDRKSVV